MTHLACCPLLCLYIDGGVIESGGRPEVVDKRETGGKSAAMEKLALSRLLRRLKDVLTIEHLVTDASTSVKALVRDLKGISSYHL